MIVMPRWKLTLQTKKSDGDIAAKVDKLEAERAVLSSELKLKDKGNFTFHKHIPFFQWAQVLF